MATQRRKTTTIRLTRRTFDALYRRAQSAGTDPDTLADEMLQKAMHQQKAPEAESEREMYRRILREGGVVLRDGAEYHDLVRPDLDLEAIRAELASIRLDPPLSETIIHMRDEK